MKNNLLYVKNKFIYIYKIPISYGYGKGGYLYFNNFTFGAL